jgi:hypothetical protein
MPTRFDQTQNFGDYELIKPLTAVDKVKNGA